MTGTPTKQSETFTCSFNGYRSSLKALEQAMDRLVWETEDGGTEEDLTVTVTRTDAGITVEFRKATSWTVEALQNGEEP